MKLVNMEQPKSQPTLKQRIDRLPIKTQMAIVTDINEYLKKEISLYEKLEQIKAQISKKQQIHKSKA